MGEKDIAEKTLEAYNDVFADIVNVLLFDGKRLVREDALTDMTTHSQYKAGKKLRGQDRDVAKYWHKGNHDGVRIAIYGFENQTEIDRDMPLRIISYDGAAYRNQLNLDKNKDKSNHILRYPVVTMVLYFGKKPWNTSKNLYSRLKIPKELKPYVSDYKINVFEICRLSKEQVNMFQSDFRIVADYFVQTYQDKEYVPSADTIKHVQEVLELLGVLIGDQDIEKRFNQTNFNQLRDGEISMEEVWQRTMTNKLNEGISIGEARGRTAAEKEFAVERAALLAEIARLKHAGTVQ